LPLQQKAAGQEEGRRDRWRSGPVVHDGVTVPERDEENVSPPGAEGICGVAESSVAGGGAARPLAAAGLLGMTG
jgi:hypothetical protein